MSVYRKDERWGKTLSEHRAARGSWLGAAFLGIAGSIGFIWYVATHHSSLQTVAGAIIMPIVTLWAGGEWLRLGRLSLRVHENGLKFHDGQSEHAIPWDEITVLVGQYVPGARRTGAEDEGNLVALVVTSPASRVSLPKELDGFSAVVEEIKARAQVPYQKVLIASLMARG